MIEIGPDTFCPLVMGSAAAAPTSCLAIPTASTYLFIYRPTCLAFWYSRVTYLSIYLLGRVTRPRRRALLRSRLLPTTGDRCEVCFLIFRCHRITYIGPTKTARNWTMRAKSPWEQSHTGNEKRARMRARGPLARSKPCNICVQEP